MPVDSPKPLWRKLGLHEGSRAVVKNTTARPIPALENELPFPLTFADAYFQGMDFVHLYVDRRSELSRQVATLLGFLDPAGTVWVSWPKKAAKTGTDITEDTIRDVVLPLGLVDVKVCSVTDDLWSGLKVVVRKELRGDWFAGAGGPGPGGAGSARPGGPGSPGR